MQTATPTIELPYDREVLTAMRDGCGDTMLADLVNKFGRERDHLRARIRQLEAPDSGQGIRVGSIVRDPYQDLDGTVIRIVGAGEYVYGAVKMTVRWTTGKITVHRQFDPDREPADGDTLPIDELADVTPLQYLNVYLHDLAWGGPEEGGWWYDTYEPVEDESELVHVTEGQDKLADKAAWCERENANRRAPSSVASEGHYLVRLEAWPAEAEPMARPRYC